jgi:hypothetical protein
MIRFNWEKIAGFAALFGGVLQATILLSQVSQLSEILTSTTHYHITWDWNISIEYRWISLIPWLFFLIALLCLHRYVAQQLHWAVWKGTVCILFSIMAIVVPELILPFVTNPNCVPVLPCNPGNRLIPLIFSSISIAGGILLGGYLLFVGIALIHASFSKVWTLSCFLLGILAFHVCLVAIEFGEWVPGYFKIDLTTMFIGLAWSATWCFIGCLLCFTAFHQDERSLDNGNYRRSRISHVE